MIINSPAEAKKWFFERVSRVRNGKQASVSVPRRGKPLVNMVAVNRATVFEQLAAPGAHRPKSGDLKSFARAPRPMPVVLNRAVAGSWLLGKQGSEYTAAIIRLCCALNMPT